MVEENIDITRNILVPEHIKLSEDEKQKLLKELNIPIKKLPMILMNDPAIKTFEPKEGDIIKILRKSKTNKETIFYRVVVHG